MSMTEDLDRIVDTVLQTDPSFRAIDPEDLERCVSDARTRALGPSVDAFLLALMRLMALPQNGHTRLIPNDAISVLPFRFVSRGTGVQLLDAAPDYAGFLGARLIAINGVPIDQIEAATQSLLAGTRQRRRVIGPILYAWPGVLRDLGILSDRGVVDYQLRHGAGDVSHVVADTDHVVTGSVFYPRNEHGKVDACWSPPAFLDVSDFGDGGMLLTLPSFFDPFGTRLAGAMSEAADLVRSRPDAPLMLDLRGNTGGDFLRTMPLIDALAEERNMRRVGVLVDKFTFSAAIVFVAILKHRLGSRLMLIGEEMGDSLTFFAEGGTLELPSTGAAVRYASAFHDWAAGRSDDTTPPEIIRELVPAGSLALDVSWVAETDEPERLHAFCRTVLRNLGD